MWQVKKIIFLKYSFLKCLTKRKYKRIKLLNFNLSMINWSIDTSFISYIMSPFLASFVVLNMFFMCLCVYTCIFIGGYAFIFVCVCVSVFWHIWIGVCVCVRQRGCMLCCNLIHVLRHILPCHLSLPFPVSWRRKKLLHEEWHQKNYNVLIWNW